MYTIKETIEQKRKGLYYGNRLILPFKANFLKIILDKEIHTDFSPGAGIHINETESFTDIYFREIKAITEKVSKYEAVKFIATEKDADVFDLNKHLKISVYLEDKHLLEIEETSADVLFIE